jgi:hypothetical protein
MTKERFDYIDKLLDYHWTMYNSIQIVLDHDDTLDHVDKYIYKTALTNASKIIHKLQEKRKKYKQ